MKYTIEGFSQQRLVELGLDTVDACILRWFVDFSHTGKMIKFVTPGGFDGIPFLWVKYQTVIDELPILGITNRDVLARRFKKMASCGLFQIHIKKADAGSFSFFRFSSDVYESLITAPDSKVGWAPYSKVGPKDSSINPNPSIKNIKILCPEETRKDIIHYLNKKALTDFRDGSQQTVKLIEARFKDGYTAEDFFAVINWKCEAWLRDNKMCAYLRPLTLFGTKFESYLNEIPRGEREGFRRKNV